MHLGIVGCAVGGLAQPLGRAVGVALDGAGNIYVGGTTASTDFPTAGSPPQPIYGGGEYDTFAAKISAVVVASNVLAMAIYRIGRARG